MSDPTIDAAPGNLQQIADPAVRSELRKLWGVVQVRGGQIGDKQNRYVTLAELEAQARSISAKIKPADKPAFRQDVSGAGASIGSDLLATDNAWSGTQTWSHESGPGAFPFQFVDLSSGPLVVPAPATILLESNYDTLVDIRKTSNQANLAPANGWGGNAALYLQHRVQGETFTPTVNCGIRVQLQTAQTGNVSPNDAVAGYFGIYNLQGVNVGAFGVHVDAYHKGVGSSITYGLSCELFREFSDGKVVGMHARIVTGGLVASQPADAAFLASPSPGGTVGFDTVFKAGADYTGFLECNYGLDTSFAHCAQAAIVLAPKQKMVLNGRYPNPEVGFKFDESGKIQFFSDLGNTFALGNDGTLFIDRPLTYAGATAPAGGVPMGNPMGFVRIVLGGFPRRLAFWDDRG